MALVGDPGKWLLLDFLVTLALGWLVARRPGAGTVEEGGWLLLTVDASTLRRASSVEEAWPGALFEP